jgi:pSer/pThr/pTyr-binding forkhead associated (FHA) protein
MSQQIPIQLTLVMRQGPQINQVFPLDKDVLTIGRATDNDIVVLEGEVSRHHARLTHQGDSWILQDLGSRNGTTVDGVRITGPVLIVSNSQIALGPNVVFGLAEGAMAAAPPPVHPTTQHVSSSTSTSSTSIPGASDKGSATWLLLGGMATLAILLIVAAALAYVYLRARPKPCLLECFQPANRRLP